MHTTLWEYSGCRRSNVISESTDKAIYLKKGKTRLTRLLAIMLTGQNAVAAAMSLAIGQHCILVALCRECLSDTNGAGVQNPSKRI